MPASIVLAYIDVIGTMTKNTRARNGASKLMAKFRAALCAELADVSAASSFSTGYVWNDSAMLVAPLSSAADPAEYVRLVCDVEAMKQAVEKNISMRTCVILVKGERFREQGKLPVSARVVPMATSSYAMANCFLIEQKAKIHPLRDSLSWFLDDRIVRAGGLSPSKTRLTEVMLPKSTKRPFHGYDRCPRRLQR